MTYLSTIIVLAIVIAGFLALLSSFTKHNRIQDQKKLEALCRSRQYTLLLNIMGAATINELSKQEEAADNFFDDYSGRLDRSLFLKLTGELYAEIHNRRVQLFALRDRVKEHFLPRDKPPSFTERLHMIIDRSQS